MARLRSPNYPYIGLPTAIERVRTIHDKDHRNRMSREVVAQHLGYGSLNGVSISVISALGKYGLLEGIDSDLQVSQDAVTILFDAPDSPERIQALRRAALKPDLFNELHKHFGGQIPSEANLLAHLQKNQFTANAAAQAAKSYRETMALVSGQSPAYDTAQKPEDNGMQDEQATNRASTQAKSSAVISLPRSGERELFTFPLSAGGSVRVLITGPAGPKEIDKLIKVLMLQKELLADDVAEDEGKVSDYAKR